MRTTSRPQQVGPRNQLCGQKQVPRAVFSVIQQARLRVPGSQKSELFCTMSPQEAVDHFILLANRQQCSQCEYLVLRLQIDLVQIFSHESGTPIVGPF